MRGSSYLKFTTLAIVPGAVVRMQGSARLWRVQSRQGGRADLMVTDRRASTRAEGIHISKLAGILGRGDTMTVAHGEDSEYRFFIPGEITTKRGDGQETSK